jgi:hypothetical protein
MIKKLKQGHKKLVSDLKKHMNKELKENTKK